MEKILLILSLVALFSTIGAKPTSTENDLARKKEKLVDVEQFLASPLMQSMLSNKTIQAVLTDPMVNSVLKNPRVQKVLSNKIVQNILNSNSINEIKGVPLLQFLLARMAPSQSETSHIQKIKPLEQIQMIHTSWTYTLLSVIDKVLEVLQKIIKKRHEPTDVDS